jgi:hypothetical protein
VKGPIVSLEKRRYPGSQSNEKIIREDLQLRTLHNPASETATFGFMGVTGIRHLAESVHKKAWSGNLE